jgi:hypothetical protein
MILKKYRPLYRIHPFIGLTDPDSIHKKRLVIRDWLMISLWYVRLKKCAQGSTPESLLEIEARVQKAKLSNVLMKV